MIFSQLQIGDKFIPVTPHLNRTAQYEKTGPTQTKLLVKDPWSMGQVGNVQHWLVQSSVNKIEEPKKRISHKLNDGFEIRSGMIVESTEPFGPNSFWLILRVRNVLIAQTLSVTSPAKHSSINDDTTWIRDTAVKVYKGWSAGLAASEYIVDIVQGIAPHSPVIWMKPE